MTKFVDKNNKNNNINKLNQKTDCWETIGKPVRQKGTKKAIWRNTTLIHNFSKAFRDSYPQIAKQYSTLQYLNQNMQIMI